MSTIGPHTARRLADLHRERGSHYVASPVFGKPEVAARAKLWVVTSGDAVARARVRPLLEATSQRVHVVICIRFSLGGCEIGQWPAARYAARACSHAMNRP